MKFEIFISFISGKLDTIELIWNIWQMCQNGNGKKIYIYLSSNICNAFKLIKMDILATAMNNEGQKAAPSANITVVIFEFH